MTTHSLVIQGMSCQHCVKSVREALARVPGVVRTEVEIGRAEIESTSEVTRAALVAALAAADFPAS